MRYLQQYEEIERRINESGNSGLSRENSQKVACLGKFFAKLSNVLPLQEEDYDCLHEASARKDLLLLAAASMRPAKRNSAGFPVLFEAVCGYAKVDAPLASVLQEKLQHASPKIRPDAETELPAVDLDV